MREIKFRAWVEFEHPKMLYDVTICCGELWEFAGQSNEHYTPDQDFHIMQYTGLKDKTGKMIYEGDLVKNDKKIGKVYFDVTTAMFMVRYKITTRFLWLKWEEQIAKPFWQGFYGAYAEVIGNIYENKELLDES